MFGVHEFCGDFYSILTFMQLCFFIIIFLEVNYYISRGKHLFRCVLNLMVHCHKFHVIILVFEKKCHMF